MPSVCGGEKEQYILCDKVSLLHPCKNGMSQNCDEKAVQMIVLVPDKRFSPIYNYPHVTITYPHSCDVNICWAVVA